MNKKQENRTKSVECPICSKQFSPGLIENHVSKCLFLNESTGAEGSSLKRSFSKEDNFITKRPKHGSEDKTSFKGSIQSFTKTLSNFSTEESLEHERTEAVCKNKIESPNIKNKQLSQKNSIPLAERMRPADIMSYVGQTHVLGPQSMLYQLLSKTEIPNIILWGPPGCGKTSLANVISNICKYCPGAKYRYVKFSATTSGVSDVKEAITIASNELKFGRKTVMFMDEIHRFNKMQQDIFLPHIESGTIKLIGATTENPSFTLNSALLSRCRVIVLEKLTIENLIIILEKAVQTSVGLICDMSNEEYKDLSKFSNYKFLIDKDTIKWLAETADGDARIALGGLELAIQFHSCNNNESSSQDVKLISLNDIKESLKKTHMLYDRKGDQHFDIISALHKSVRASDENAALYWLTRMMSGGEDPMYIARRLVRMSSEDIGLADPKALGVAVHTMNACKMLGMPDCDILLAQCTTYLARAPKSRLMEDALRAAQQLVANYKGAQPSVPLHLRNAPTRLMKNLDYGKGYNMMNKEESGLTYLPEEIKDIDFFDGK